MNETYLYLLIGYFWLNAVILGAVMVEASRKGPLVTFLTLILAPFIGLLWAVGETLYLHLVYPIYKWVSDIYKPSFYFHFYFGPRYRDLEYSEIKNFKEIEKKHRKSRMLKHKMLHKRVKMVLDREAKNK